ncbi:MAG: hypothetical protein K8I30_04705 [Anaerolineae bacterium]|nr:hypothetical protein [Anaerolineae bacterium]
MSEKNKRDDELEPRDRNFGGILLIGIGLLVLLINLTKSDVFGVLILPVLGIIFLAWGFYTHRIGFAIPGCILTGLGLGVFIITRDLGLTGDTQGGIVVLGLAAGFAAITLITPYFGEKRAWWALVPGGILGLVGVLLVIGGDAMRWLEAIGYLWPLILVAIGVYILFGKRLRHQ